MSGGVDGRPGEHDGDARGPQSAAPLRLQVEGGNADQAEQREQEVALIHGATARHRRDDRGQQADHGQVDRKLKGAPAEAPLPPARRARVSPDIEFYCDERAIIW